MSQCHEEDTGTDLPSPGGPAHRRVNLDPGLYLVATPIGTARDITLRALDILASADVLACEDTRTTRHLMDLHGIPVGNRPMVPYHDHNGAAQRPKLLGWVADGRSVAYCSDAGTPLIADPGYQLVHDAALAGHLVTAAPGPSAVLTALSISGLPSDRFLFVGFPPAGGGARKTWIAGFAQTDATVILFESPKRIAKLVAELRAQLGDDRRCVLCRELTKRFEERIDGTLEDLARKLAEQPARGECVLLLDRTAKANISQEEVDTALRLALRDGTVSRAAAEVAKNLGLAKRDVYQRALALRDED